MLVLPSPRTRRPICEVTFRVEYDWSSKNWKITRYSERKFPSISRLDERVKSEIQTTRTSPDWRVARQTRLNHVKQALLRRLHAVSTLLVPDRRPEALVSTLTLFYYLGHIGVIAWVKVDGVHNYESRLADLQIDKHNFANEQISLNFGPVT